jgi:RNA polymerase sigma-70 factor (ECF subfamily)
MEHGGGPLELIEDAGEAALSDDVLFARLYPDLRRFAAVVASADTDPDDLVQEAVSRALRKGPLLRFENPGAYLRRSIVNLAANERRRLGRGRRAKARAGAGESERPADYPSDLADLLRLPPDARAAVWLVDVEGWDFEAVARLLGCSPEAARARASRARKTLRRTIEEETR